MKKAVQYRICIGKGLLYILQEQEIGEDAERSRTWEIDAIRNANFLRNPTFWNLNLKIFVSSLSVGMGMCADEDHAAVSSLTKVHDLFHWISQIFPKVTTDMAFNQEWFLVHLLNWFAGCSAKCYDDRSAVNGLNHWEKFVHNTAHNQWRRRREHSRKTYQQNQSMRFAQLVVVLKWLYIVLTTVFADGTQWNRQPRWSALLNGEVWFQNLYGTFWKRRRNLLPSPEESRDAVPYVGCCDGHRIFHAIALHSAGGGGSDTHGDSKG